MKKRIRTETVNEIAEYLETLPEPDPNTRSPYLERMLSGRQRILNMREKNVSWPEIIPVIFPKNRPSLRTFKRLWARLKTEA